MKKAYCFTQHGCHGDKVAVLHIGYSHYVKDVRLFVYKGGSERFPVWYCCDSKSGLSFSCGCTRKEAVEKAVELFPKFAEYRHTNQYQKQCDALHALNIVTEEQYLEMVQ